MGDDREPGDATSLATAKTPRPGSAPRRSGFQLGLLGGFELRGDRGPIPLPVGAQRLIAFLALHERPLRRLYVAGTLWPDVWEERAGASLRSMLWRIHRHGPLIESKGDQLVLTNRVHVDLREAEAALRRERDDDAVGLGLDYEAALFANDLLPGWYDNWVVLERERFRQLRLRALDALCERLTVAGHLDAALDAALLSVAGEPLRESAHRALIRVHLADGNIAEAIRQYEFCRRLLRSQLGIEPSDRMRELVAPYRTAES